jgi:hypothetical protein
MLVAIWFQLIPGNLSETFSANIDPGYETRFFHLTQVPAIRTGKSAGSKGVLRDPLSYFRPN